MTLVPNLTEGMNPQCQQSKHKGWRRARGVRAPGITRHQSGRVSGSASVGARVGSGWEDRGLQGIRTEVPSGTGQGRAGAGRILKCQGHSSEKAQNPAWRREKAMTMGANASSEGRGPAHMARAKL